jgi:hypothetical protein
MTAWTALCIMGVCVYVVEAPDCVDSAVHHGWRCVCVMGAVVTFMTAWTAPCVPPCVPSCVPSMIASVLVRRVCYSLCTLQWRGQQRVRGVALATASCVQQCVAAAATPCAAIHPCGRADACARVLHGHTVCNHTPPRVLAGADACARVLQLHVGVQPYTHAGVQQAKCLAESIYCMLLQLFIGDADSCKESLYYRDFNHVLSTNRRHR